MSTTRRYAQGTTVSVDKTLLEIQTLLRRRGAKNVGVQYSDYAGSIYCELKDRMLKFTVPFTSARSEAEKRRKWRCVLTSIKGRFVEIEEGMGVFDEVFLPNIVVNQAGQTVYETLAGKLPSVSTMPALAAGRG